MNSLSETQRGWEVECWPQLWLCTGVGLVTYPSAPSLLLMQYFSILGRQVLSFGHPQCLTATETMAHIHGPWFPLPPPPSRAQWVTLLACHGHDSNPTDDPHLLLHPSCVPHQTSHFSRGLWLLPQQVRSQTLLV